jgi:hypothetical protein
LGLFIFWVDLIVLLYTTCVLKSILRSFYKILLLRKKKLKIKKFKKKKKKKKKKNKNKKKKKKKKDSDQFTGKREVVHTKQIFM